MSKTQLQTNNAKLEALITELQGKAAGGGGGGSAETCTVNFEYTAPPPVNDPTIYYIGSDGSWSSTSLPMSSGSVTVMKNSFVFCLGNSGSMSRITGGELILSSLQYLTYDRLGCMWFINDDAYISYE